MNNTNMNTDMNHIDVKETQHLLDDCIPGTTIPDTMSVDSGDSLSLNNTSIDQTLDENNHYDNSNNETNNQNLVNKDLYPEISFKNNNATIFNKEENQSLIDKYIPPQLKEFENKFNMSSRLPGLREQIWANKDNFSSPTMFNQLDTTLGGGLQAGLYVIGATSSLGKTALTLQVADNIAKNGNKVLYFSLEMTSGELATRSVSRISALLAKDRFGDTHNAKTSQGIFDGSRYEKYSKDELQLIDDSFKAYDNIAKNLYVIENDGDEPITSEDIKQAVDFYVEFTGNKPIVFVDYLQYLAPFKDGVSDKQNMDRAVQDLKNLSAKHNIPIWVISSFSRAAYNVPVSMSSFKDSGSIEYSANVLMGLELATVTSNKKDFNEQEERSKVVRELTLKILKNRNGSLGTPIRFGFDTRFGYMFEK